MDVLERAGNEIAAVLWECCTVEECENTLAEINPDDWKRAAQKAIEVADRQRGVVLLRDVLGLLRGSDSDDHELEHWRREIADEIEREFSETEPLPTRGGV